MDGFLYINKEIGWTSRDVCNKVQSLFHQKKVGHIGTLDPFATGLLIVTLGKGTKAGRFLEDGNKEYIATLELGKKTNTADLTGEIIKTVSVPSFSIEKINDTLTSFVGEYEQLPPMTSAIKINGVKLYNLAHQGQEIDRKKRKVKINEIELLSYEGNTLKFRCNVSKGTYVRTLGEDIAERLGVVGYLSSLHRTKIANANIVDAKLISEVKESDLIDIVTGLSHLTKVMVNNEEVAKVKNGITLKFDFIKKDSIILLVDSNNFPLAVYELSDKGTYSCLRGLWS